MELICIDDWIIVFILLMAGIEKKPRGSLFTLRVLQAPPWPEPVAEQVLQVSSQASKLMFGNSGLCLGHENFTEGFWH
jgi:hypothetical protein